MAGYSYISGVGGPGANQVGGISPNLRMMDATTQQQNPLASGTNPLSTGGYATTANAPGPGQATPAQQTALGSNATNIPGFGYINNNYFTGQSLNGLGASNFTNAQINALNQANGGYTLGQSVQGTGALQGINATYGYVPQTAQGYGGNAGGDNLGDYFKFGGQTYAGGTNGVNAALGTFNSDVNAFNAWNSQGNGQGTSAYTGGPSFQSYPGASAPTDQTTLQGVYQYLAANPYLQNFVGTGANVNGSGGGLFSSFYNDPSYRNYLPQTGATAPVSSNSIPGPIR